MAKIISLMAHPGAARRTDPGPPDTRAQILFFTGVRYERPAPRPRRSVRKPKRATCAATAAEILA
ncbi:MAG: hypothetical protein KGQ37_04885 [Hyphomicrobiales bacterium]|nr:hypothetical protein [Hyphomicrobiales bacterium]